jgi:hypothetical protein
VLERGQGWCTTCSSIVFNDEVGTVTQTAAVAAARLNAGMGFEVLQVELSGQHEAVATVPRPTLSLFASRQGTVSRHYLR